VMWPTPNNGMELTVQKHEGRREGQALETPYRRQSANHEGRRRRPRAGVHREDAGLEARRGAAARRAHRTQRARRAQGRDRASLRPVPPGGSGKDARWINIREDDLDEAQMATWVKQAAASPGWVPGRPS
jgi:hypothetical protein